MELPQLQQYATLHKNDPYIVTLALSIANQKKQMKTGQDGQAGMMPQPKVADQQIAQMLAPPPQQMAAAPQQQMAQALPEDQGIGTLPAQNMQNFAGGGIVAFGGGGDVPGFQSGAFMGELSPQQIAELYKTDPKLAAQAEARASRAVVGNAVGNAVGKGLTLGAKAVPAVALGTELFYTSPDEIARLKAAEAKKSPAARTAAAQSVLNESPEDYALRKVSELEAKGGKQLSPDARNMAMSQFVKDKIGGQVKRGDASLTTSSDLADPKNIYKYAPKGVADLPAGSSEADYMSGINKLIRGSQTSGASIPSISTAFDLNPERYKITAPQLASATPKDMADRLAAGMGPNPTVSPLAGQQEEVNKANVTARQNAAKDLEQQFEKQGLAFKDTLEKLTSKEARVKTMEDNQLGMSMFEAGLAMLAGDSPYAMVNIGKGAQVGTKKYMEIQDKVEGARDKIDEAKMKIEEFRRNEANMNARELRAARKDVDDAVSNGAQASLNLMRENYGMKFNQGLAFVNNSYMLDKFNAETTLSTAVHNQNTAKDIDLTRARLSNESNIANANMANQRAIEANRAATQLGLAQLEAKRLPAEARSAMLLGTGKTDAERLESGMRKMQEIASDKTGAVYAKLYAEHVTDARKNMTTPMTPTQFADSMRGILTSMAPKVVKTPGADATVLDRPK
jgi:hypothetical protein